MQSTSTSTPKGKLLPSLLLFSLLSLAGCGTVPVSVQTKECPPHPRIPRELLSPTSDLPLLIVTPSSPTTTMP